MNLTKNYLVGQCYKTNLLIGFSLHGSDVLLYLGSKLIRVERIMNPNVEKVLYIVH